MAVAYTPTSLSANGLIRGFAANQTGIYLSSMTETYTNPENEVLDALGALAGFTNNLRVRRTISCDGTVNSTSTGLVNEVFGTALTFSTSVEHGDEFGFTTGGIFMDGNAGVSISQSNDAEKQFSGAYWDEEGFTGT